MSVNNSLVKQNSKPKFTAVINSDGYTSITDSRDTVISRRYADRLNTSTPLYGRQWSELITA